MQIKPEKFMLTLVGIAALAWPDVEVVAQTPSRKYQQPQHRSRSYLRWGNFQMALM